MGTRRSRARRGDAAPGPRGASTIVCAAATFAPTSFARLRLIRQLHAAGLLRDPGAQQPTPSADLAVPARRS